MHRTELFVPECSAPKVEFAVKKLKRYKSPGVDQILSELFQNEGETLHCEILKLIKLIRNKIEVPYQWKESIVVPIYKCGDKSDCSNSRGIS
jgi:hypothetical protein